MHQSHGSIETALKKNPQWTQVIQLITLSMQLPKSLSWRYC